MSMIIKTVNAWEALDSRGRPTVGCRVELAGGASGRAIAPSGASTGSHEAHELRDGGSRYGGYGVRRAVQNVHKIALAIIGLDASDQQLIDTAIDGLDPDPAFGTLGANASLAVSLAVMTARANAQRQPLWRSLSEELDPAEQPLRPKPDPRLVLPMPMINIISGGAHAASALDIQDVLVIPIGATSFIQAIEWASRVRAAAAELLITAGHPAALVADEGGLAAALGTNERALRLIRNAIEKAGLDPTSQVAIAVDFAANQIVRDGRYRLATEGAELTVKEWLTCIQQWCVDYELASVEDVLHEDDWVSWKAFAAEHAAQRQVLGDDLFATNLQRLEQGIEQQAANAVLIKLNQAGTVSRGLRVLQAARKAGWGTVVSARSGDTEDSWLADLAVGWQAGQIKVGSTTRSERTAKWNRLLEIESLAGRTATIAPWSIPTATQSPSSP